MKLGILGGGQLGWMMALAGERLGVSTVVFEPAADAVARRAAEHVCADWDDVAALREFAERVDVITYEFENVPASVLQAIEGSHPGRPSVHSLAVCQDRVVEKRFLEDADIPVARWREVTNETELHDAVRDVGVPSVLKTCRFGYDGKGQFVLRNESDCQAAWRAVGEQRSILESFVPFRRELSCVSVRSLDGAIRHYPLCENVHRQGILHLTTAPAKDVPPALQRSAESHAVHALEALDHVGVLTVEYFEREGRLIANEMAPRVHNSGHWTIEGAATSQFENHVRAVTGMDLGDTTARGFCAMFNLVGSLPPEEDVRALPGASLHVYGKEARAGRKLGHFTLVEQSSEVLEALMPEGERVSRHDV